MAIGTLTQKLRPVRIAFLVNPTQRDRVQKAIHINSLLWGGMFNPIIPCYKKLPKSWSKLKSKDDTAINVIKGYLEGFDPDFVVNLSSYAPEKINIDESSIIDVEKLLTSIDLDDAPNVGSGIFEVLDQFIYDEMRFVRKDPIKFIRPNIEGRHKLFLSSLYGDLGDFEESFYEKHLSDFDVFNVNISLSEYLNFMLPEYMFSRRLGAAYLEQRLRGPILFYLDATNTLDVIDYWNLRAAGWDVFPFPKQAEKEKSVRQMAERIIEDSYRPYRYSKKLYHHAKFIKSRGTHEQDIKEFSDSLSLSEPIEGKGPKITIQNWYPRIWSDWARRNAREYIIPAFSKSKDVELQEGQRSFRFKLIQPKFEVFSTSTGEPRFSVEIDSRVYGDDKLMAQAIPLGGEQVSRVVGRYSLGEWRISKNGPVYLSRHQDRVINYELPLAENVMKAWFGDKGWNVEISPSGKIAKQMISQLGGTHGIAHLKHKKLLKLFQDLNNKGFISESKFKAQIAQIVSEDGVWIERDKYIQNLLDKNIFQLGIQLVCPTCTQKTWYSLNRVSNSVQCASCLNDYNTQSIGVNDKQWAYKASGTFGLPKQAYGAFSVLLTLSALTNDIHEKFSPILSFDANKGNKNIEADLCLFVEKEFRDEVTQELVFAECKTYNKFENKDIERMKVLAKEFPGSVLVFATTRNELTSTEKSMIKPLVNSGRRHWKSEQIYNPVIILTGTELFSSNGIPYCWDGKEGKAGEFKKGNFYPRDLSDLADATQQIYLDMEPYHEWQAEQWKKRQRIKH